MYIHKKNPLSCRPLSDIHFNPFILIDATQGANGVIVIKQRSLLLAVELGVARAHSPFAVRTLQQGWDVVDGRSLVDGGGLVDGGRPFVERRPTTDVDVLRRGTFDHHKIGRIHPVGALWLSCHE